LSKELWKLVAVITLAVIVVAYGPIACIWAFNTLFGTTIPFTFKTWLASLILSATVYGKTK